MSSSLLDIRIEFPQTSLWSATADPLAMIESIGWGASGAAPELADVAVALRQDPERLAARLERVAELYPAASPHELGSLLAEDLLLDVAAALLPTYEKNGRDGRVTIPADPARYRGTDYLIEQASALGALAVNALVALPATQAGILAMEEASVNGVSVAAVACASVAQALAAAEAIERGLARRESSGQSTAVMAPVVAISLGALDAHFRLEAERKGAVLEPGSCEWTGIAVFKEAYRLFAERAYTTRLLAADITSGHQVTELLGGDVIIAPSLLWQRRIARAEPTLRRRIDTPIPSARLMEVTQALPDFEVARAADGLTSAQFERFGPVRADLRRHHAASAEITQLVIDLTYPA